MRSQILFICGSLNQTLMMHKISRHLADMQCYFTPFYAEGFLGLLSKAGALDFTILGGRHRQHTLDYLAKEKLAIDEAGQQRNYDLVVTCTDLIVQSNIRKRRLVLVQEGMMDQEGPFYSLMRRMHLPRFIANTAATGLSDAYDVFCVASQGYRDLFVHKGIKPEKIIVTGIPNFDNAQEYLDNDFPYRDYVLAATSSLRETGKRDNRQRFLESVRRIAAGRPVIFKLHPNENTQRAIREIHATLPEAQIFTDGNTNHMIANCAVLITQTSSVVYTGMALGKEVYSFFDLAMLRKLMPQQNDGKSAARIGEICKRIAQIPLEYLRHPQRRFDYLKQWRLLDGI